MMNYLLLLHIFQTTNVNARRGSFDSSSLKPFHNKCQVGYFCMYSTFLSVVKRMKLKANLMFWICLIVASGFMESLEDMAMNRFTKPSISGKMHATSFLVYWW